MRELLIDVLLAVLGLAVLGMPWWVPFYHRWIDERRVRKANERREAFHGVKFEGEKTP